MQARIGKYEVEKRLGAGAFGDVFQAMHPYLQKRVAIKKLKAAQAVAGHEGPDTRVTFADEARETSKLAHPNIVTVHDFDIDESDGSPYLVMELLEGQTLEKLIARRGDMTLFEKMEIMQQVGEGLQFAHSRNVIHRDIKPANIMVLSDGTAKVMDFSVSPEGYMTGTPSYMPPEQFRGVADALTDVFSYGAVYYELLTGQKAFTSPDEDPGRASNSHYVPPRAGTLVRECPAWLDDMVSRLMEKRRDQRIGNLEEMLSVSRPILLKMKRERADELAAGVEPLLRSGQREEAALLIERILRLDPLNPRARAGRDQLQSGKRVQARASAQAMVEDGRARMLARDFEGAVNLFEQAAALDIGNQGIEKLLGDARAKAEDARTANRLVDEILDAITHGWGNNPAAWEVQSAFENARRASELDDSNQDAATLRKELQPLYEEMWDRKMAGAASAEMAPGGPGEVYEKRLKEALKARKNREFDYALEILRKLQTTAGDDRVAREIAAVEDDRTGYVGAEAALREAERLKATGDLDGARRVLENFAEQYPRHGRWVQNQRMAIGRELGTYGG